MERETIFETELRKVRKQPKWKNLVALRAAVEPAELEHLIQQKDERIVNAVLSMSGKGGAIRAVDIQSKKFIEKILRAASWDKRLYAIFAPTGVGKTFGLETTMPTIEGKISYVRVTEFNKGNKIGLLQQIARGFGFIGFESVKGFRAHHGNPYFFKIREKFENENGVVVIDEAQKLKDNAYEMLRDLYDETNLSMVIVGSTALSDRLATKRIGDEVFGQMLRRFDDRYILPHASPADVKLFLSAFSIEIDSNEAKQIARKIGTWGDIDTLNKAMRFISGEVWEGEMTWTKVGAGNILEAIDRVITLMQPMETANGNENK